MQAAPAPPPPPPSTLRVAPQAIVPTTMDLVISNGVQRGAERIVIYGTGGIGKSYLASFLPAPFFLDVETGTRHLELSRDVSITTWSELRGKIAGVSANPPEWLKTLVVDTATVAELLALAHVVAFRKTEYGKDVTSIEGFGWGKGWQYLSEEFNLLLADLDRVITAGINVCLVAHDVIAPVPNPDGENFIRWEPCLYNGDKNGRGSIRARVKQWSDHMLFISYDKEVEAGKAQGSGTRTIYTSEMPTHVAKTRGPVTSRHFTLEDPGAVWRDLGITSS